MDNDNWPKNLKPGDKVIYQLERWESVRKVEKITPKGFIRVSGILFSPEFGFSGECYARGYSGATISEYTPEKEQQIADSELIIQTACRMEVYINNHDALQLDRWKRIKAILDEQEGKGQDA